MVARRAVRQAAAAEEETAAAAPVEVGEAKILLASTVATVAGLEVAAGLAVEAAAAMEVVAAAVAGCSAIRNRCNRSLRCKYCTAIQARRRHKSDRCGMSRCCRTGLVPSEEVGD